MSAFVSSAGVSTMATSDLVLLDFLQHLITHSTTPIVITTKMTPPTLINTIARVLMESSSELVLLFAVVVLFDVVLLVVLFVVTGGSKVSFTLKLEATFVVVVAKLPVVEERVPKLDVVFMV